jgi:formate dehydrogenase accessory protein FdhE
MTFETAVQQLRALAFASARLKAQLPNGVPDPDAAQVRLTEGIPALAAEPLVDWPTMAANAQTFGADINNLVSTYDRDALVEAALAGSWDMLDGRADVITLLDYAVRPALRAGYVTVRHLITALDWTRGTCPACGALPLLAELRAAKDGNSRILRCGRCTAAWSFARLACPACNERDHEQLRYVHVAGEVERRRAECCVTCGFYVKAVARLDALGADELFELDLETVGLDALAIDAGYHRRAPNAV